MIKYIYKAVILLTVFFVVSSCEDYLDKSIETDLTINEVFKNFNNAQGFTEEMYAMVVDYGTAGHWQHFMCIGEDVIGNDTWQFHKAVDEGRYWSWMSDGGSMFYEVSEDGNPITGQNKSLDRHGIWQSSWAGIRKANIVIANADSLMVDASQQEIDAVLGQAYFFRGYFHHEIMKFWGRIPYFNTVLSGDNWQLPRPATWAETALKIDEDFERAAELLPDNWDDSDWEPGERTRGVNQFRVTRGGALAFKGKNLLYAASPLMQENSGTYQYDKELASQAVDAFAEVLKMARYQLLPWDKVHENFYVQNTEAYPYSSEYIFSQAGDVNWWRRYLALNFQLGALCGENSTSFPTHNYVHNYFGMSDGLACDDSPNYDPTDPWANRDPRFYKWITVDGDQMVENLGAATGDNEKHRYAQFYSGGAHRYPGVANGSYTGYVAKKWYPISYNNFDNKQSMVPHRIHMRLTDVYLMYAEAALVAYGINGVPPSHNLSALDAINKIRERAMPDGSLNVQDSYLTSDEKFMDEIRRDRAVEMCFEGHRWMDVRRWKLGTDMKYREKTELIFDRNADGKPINIREKVILTKVFDEKHYWLPFPKDDVELYEGFPQNPGWD
jgi:hypothetical protein